MVRDYLRMMWPYLLVAVAVGFVMGFVGVILRG